MHYLVSSWESVTSDTVRNCFHKCGFRRVPGAEETQEPSDDYAEIDEEFRSTGADGLFSEFVAVDDNVLTCEPQSVAEIVAEVRGGEASDSDEDDEEDIPTTFAQAAAGLDALRSFFRDKENSAADKNIRELEKQLYLSNGRTLHQRTLVDYFKQ